MKLKCPSGTERRFTRQTVLDVSSLSRKAENDIPSDAASHLVRMGTSVLYAADRRSEKINFLHFPCN